MILRKKTPIGALSVAVGCALLSACANVVIHKPLADTSRNNIRSIDVRVVVPQEGPIFSARAPGISAAAGGGLIPALIDASVQKSRQEELISKLPALLDVVHDFDFREEYSVGLKSTLQGSFPLKFRKLTVTSSGLSKDAASAAIAATKDGTSILQLITFYELEPNFSALTVRTTASLWSEGNPEKTYGNILIFQATSESLDLDRNIEFWKADGGRRLREGYLSGIRETLRMLTLDLEAKPVSDQGSNSTNPTTEKIGFNMAGSLLQMEVAVLASGGGRAIVRNKAGMLYSLPR